MNATGSYLLGAESRKTLACFVLRSKSWVRIVDVHSKNVSIDSGMSLLYIIRKFSNVPAPTEIVASGPVSAYDIVVYVRSNLTAQTEDVVCSAFMHKEGRLEIVGVPTDGSRMLRVDGAIRIAAAVW